MMIPYAVNCGCIATAHTLFNVAHNIRGTLTKHMYKKRSDNIW